MFAAAFATPVFAGELSKSPLEHWKRPGKIWSVWIDAFYEGMQEPVRYRFSFHHAPPMTDNGVEYSRLIVTPTDNMPGNAVRNIAVLVDKQDGWPRKAFALPAKTKPDLKIAAVDGAFVIVDAPPDAPLEALPFAPTRTYRAGAAVVNYVQTRIGDDTLLDMSYAVDGKEKLRVRQRWRDGDLWWRYYEKHIDGRLALRGRLTEAEVVPDPFINAPLPSKPKIKTSGLSLDKRLDALVRIEAVNPPLGELLRRIEAAAGVELTLAPSLADHAPQLGGLSGKRGFAAWQLMDLVAQKQLDDGRWEKTEKGYRLVGVSKASAPTERPKPTIPKTEQNRRFLATDPKLKVLVSIVGQQPPLDDVLRALREATGLELTLDAKLARHDPDLGAVELRKAPAWMVLAFVASKDLSEGHWEAVNGGYRLTAQASLREKPLPAAASFPFALAAVALGAVVVAGLLVFVRWKRGS